MIEGDIELSHLVEEYDQATEEEKKQFRADTQEQLERMAILYKHQNKDDLGILTVICEALGFKAYPGQSMIGNEDIIHFINNKEQLLELVFNEYPDDEILETIRSE
jgi:hypothetical protein